MQNKSSLLDIQTATCVADLFCSFSDTSRVRILSAILEQEMSVSALAALLGLTESAVSHQMRGLRQMSIVDSRRAGKEVYYQVTDPHIINLFLQGVKHVHEG
jgi:DNA-binding transcriptional ArsR family regulator